MFLHYRTIGIVLDKMDYREADQILVVYTRDFGKIEILCRGIRKISSKLRSQIDLLTLSELEFIQGKLYKTLTDAILIDKFPKIKNSLPKLKIALALCELIDKLTPLQEGDLNQSNFIFSTFKILNNIRIISKEKLLLFYLYCVWKFIANIGYTPDFYHCYFCHTKIKENEAVFFSKRGEILCLSCAKQQGKNLIKLNPNLLVILRLLSQDKEWQDAYQIKLKPKEIQVLIEIGHSYLANLSVS